MITAFVPRDWNELEDAVADLLTKCGMAVERARTVSTVRGQAEIDVYAIEVVDRRAITLFCECKHWKASIPQGVVHTFRSIVGDAGAHQGYIISSSSFQSGAVAAAKQTNIRLLTWREFQEEFEPAYYEKYFRKQLQQSVDPLISYVEPISPATFLASGRLDEANVPAFLELKERYEEFGFLCLSIFPGMLEVRTGGKLELPLDDPANAASTLRIPEALRRVDNYEDFLTGARELADTALAEFRRLVNLPGAAA